MARVIINFIFPNGDEKTEHLDSTDFFFNTMQKVLMPYLFVDSKDVAQGSGYPIFTYGDAKFIECFDTPENIGITDNEIIHVAFRADRKADIKKDLYEIHKFYTRVCKDRDYFIKLHRSLEGDIAYRRLPAHGLGTVITRRIAYLEEQVVSKYTNLIFRENYWIARYITPEDTSRYYEKEELDKKRKKYLIEAIKDSPCIKLWRERVKEQIKSAFILSEFEILKILSLLQSSLHTAIHIDAALKVREDSCDVSCCDTLSSLQSWYLEKALHVLKHLAYPTSYVHKDPGSVDELLPQINLHPASIFVNLERIFSCTISPGGSSVNINLKDLLKRDSFCEHIRGNDNFKNYRSDPKIFKRALYYILETKFSTAVSDATTCLPPQLIAQAYQSQVISSYTVSPLMQAYPISLTTVDGSVISCTRATASGANGPLPHSYSVASVFNLFPYPVLLLKNGLVECNGHFLTTDEPKYIPFLDKYVPLGNRPLDNVKVIFGTPLKRDDCMCSSRSRFEDLPKCDAECEMEKYESTMYFITHDGELYKAETKMLHKERKCTRVREYPLLLTASANVYGMVAITLTGDLVVEGKNYCGQFGLGLSEYQELGHNHHYTLTRIRKEILIKKAFGEENYSEMSDDTPVDVSLGHSHTIILMSSGNIVFAGDATRGQSGLDTFDKDSCCPGFIHLSKIPKVKTLIHGPGRGCCVILADDRVAVWGSLAGYCGRGGGFRTPRILPYAPGTIVAGCYSTDNYNLSLHDTSGEIHTWFYNQIPPTYSDCLNIPADRRPSGSSAYRIRPVR